MFEDAADMVGILGRMTRRGLKGYGSASDSGSKDASRGSTPKTGEKGNGNGNGNRNGKIVHKEAKKVDAVTTNGSTT